MHKGDKKNDDGDNYDNNNNNNNNNNNSDDDDNDSNNKDLDYDKLRDHSSIQKYHTNIGLISNSYRGMNIYSKYRAVDILSRCCVMNIWNSRPCEHNSDLKHSDSALRCHSCDRNFGHYLSPEFWVHILIPVLARVCAPKLWERVLRVWEQLAEDSILEAYDAALLDIWIPAF
jgi:hypothetical protein